MNNANRFLPQKDYYEEVINMDDDESVTDSESGESEAGENS